MNVCVCASPCRPEIPAIRGGDDGVITFSRGKLVEELASQGKLKVKLHPYLIHPSTHPRHPIQSIHSLLHQQACILATFNLDLPDLEEEFPCLFPSPSSSSSSSSRSHSPIETLILTVEARIHRDYPLKPDGMYL